MPRRFIRRALRAAIYLLRSAHDALATPELVTAEQKRAVDMAMNAHDMVEAPDESYYRDRYLELIEPHLPATGRLLDAACGSGRLLMPLARRMAAKGGSIVGVDYLDSAIDAARHNADGLDNVELQCADLVPWLRSQPDASFDAVVFLEAGYIMPQLPEALAGLARTIKPGAPLFVSLRPRAYVARLAVQQRNWSAARTVIESAEGELEGIGWQRWHEPAAVAELLSAHGFRDVTMHAIGAASGIEGDPLAALARPSGLEPWEREELAAVERALGACAPGSGRYVLAMARRG